MATKTFTGFAGALCWRERSLCVLRGDVQGSAAQRWILLHPSLSLQSYLPENQRSGLLLSVRRCIKLASSQRWLPFFSRGRENWPSAEVKQRQVPSCHWKAGGQAVPLIFLERNTHIVRDRCQQRHRQRASRGKLRRGKEQVAGLEVGGAPQHRCLSVPECC